MWKVISLIDPLIKGHPCSEESSDMSLHGQKFVFVSAEQRPREREGTFYIFRAKSRCIDVDHEPDILTRPTNLMYSEIR